MAPKKKDTKNAFQEIIHAARERRRQQATADKFFSEARSQKARITQKPARKDTSKALEKRVAPGGIRKAEPPRKPAPRRSTRDTREARLLSSALPEPDISIRGRATGPTAVLGSNFAPGTTAEDIQSAFETVGGRMLRCRIITTYPAVMAEMMFADRRGAEDVVAKFNNQKADGKVLHIRIKPEIT